jgi:hypothetical protein
VSATSRERLDGLKTDGAPAHSRCVQGHLVDYLEHAVLRVQDLAATDIWWVSRSNVLRTGDLPDMILPLQVMSSRSLAWSSSRQLGNRAPDGNRFHPPP